jgi:hypothetical protein
MTITLKLMTTAAVVLLALVGGGGTAAIFMSSHFEPQVGARLGLLFTFVLPFVFGYFRPRQAWVWGVLVTGGQLLMIPVANEGDHSQAPLGLYVYAVLVPATILFGILGAWTSRRIRQRGRSNSSAPGDA